MGNIHTSLGFVESIQKIIKVRNLSRQLDIPDKITRINEFAFDDNNNFCSGGVRGASTSVIWTSKLGYSWTLETSTIFTNGVNSITWISFLNKFAGVTITPKEIGSSATGVTWLLDYTHTSNLRKIRNNGNNIIVTSDNGLIYSNNLTGWTLGAGSVVGRQLDNIASHSDNSKWFAEGTLDGHISLDNGVNWSVPTNFNAAMSGQQPTSINYVNDRWIIGGTNGKLIYAKDSDFGVSMPFTTVSSIASIFSGESILSIDYGDGVWIACGSDNNGLTTVAASFDNMGTWEKIICGEKVGRQIKYNNLYKRWYVVGDDSEIYISLA